MAKSKFKVFKISGYIVSDEMSDEDALNEAQLLLDRIDNAIEGRIIGEITIVENGDIQVIEKIKKKKK